MARVKQLSAFLILSLLVLFGKCKKSFLLKKINKKNYKEVQNSIVWIYKVAMTLESNDNTCPTYIIKLMMMIKIIIILCVYVYSFLESGIFDSIEKHIHAPFNVSCLFILSLFLFNFDLSFSRLLWGKSMR